MLIDYDFFNGFTPRIIEVAIRDKQVWEQLDYQIARERTGLHSLAYVYGGEGQLTFAGEDRSLGPGDLFQIWPGHPMRLTSSRSNPLHFYSFLFQYRIIQWDGGTMLSLEPAGRLPLQLGNGGPEKAALESSFREAYELWHEKNNGYEWHVKLQLLSVLRLIQRLGANREDHPDAASAVQKAIQYMKQSFKENLTRDQLAGSISLSPGYFSVLFKAHTGVSPMRYLNKIRMDQSKLLLRNTNIPIKQVAEECGFEDSFYFSRLFQKETGMSPRQFRKS
ncbi:AraC family transcriptional regulator [Paenibacillus glycanilyticus]|uniref:Transcriptional regulator n=1 Tax=Paenibacillus glycanilyticus TaxID=126569 RepID=A0ABQ6G7L5_9BACL|nr:AraC family transcriptional regulator [Paenibacillus glycanilyticus]GLX66974.1 transcriptional regulator [Paenibacillus glycanilyticus]